ncbi:uncharacterized protein LOC101855566 isoform X1 [Aplysia californica]|uniref:Uncharacterized protein LOC101855566 isoform X1 n=1 Tax=Aplysia californica TaxID=6500 RepID=A0ABM0JR92_APLCA|nr:uncharacterized protein LOC101855566 isoform X1 [Aplysia californica]
MSARHRPTAPHPDPPPSYRHPGHLQSTPHPDASPSSGGYPGPPPAARSFYAHRLCRVGIQRHTRTTFTPQSWFLGQFGFTGYYVTTGGDRPLDMKVGVYLCSGHEELHRPIRCRVTLLGSGDHVTERMVLLEETRASVEEWMRGVTCTLRLVTIPTWAWDDGSLLFRYDTEWC